MNPPDLTMTSKLKSTTGPAAVDIRSFQPGTADAKAFRSLNEEWITKFFTMEARDFEILGDPETSILKHGGHIYMAYLGLEAVGCFALERMSGDVYELSKMAVTPYLRGQGVGRRLLEYAIQRARALGAKSLFLGSNTKLAGAVHLYESVGFQHLPPGEYRRCNILAPTYLWRKTWTRRGTSPSLIRYRGRIRKLSFQAKRGQEYLFGSGMTDGGSHECTVSLAIRFGFDFDD